MIRVIDASHNRSEQKTCGNKIRWSSLERAKLAGISTAKKFQNNFNVYECPFCGYYHIGNSKTKKKKKNKNGRMATMFILSFLEKSGIVEQRE